MAILAMALLSGCGGGSDADPLAGFNISNDAALVYSALVVLTRGTPPDRVAKAKATIYPATLDFIESVRAGRDEVGDDEAYRQLSKMADSVEGWCDECQAALERELSDFD